MKVSGKSSMQCSLFDGRSRFSTRKGQETSFRRLAQTGTGRGPMSRLLCPTGLEAG